MLLRHPKPCGVCPLGKTRGRPVFCEGGCSCAGWGAMVRRYVTASIPSEREGLG
jgi:hypothetical protein